MYTYIYIPPLSAFPELIYAGPGSLLLPPPCAPFFAPKYQGRDCIINQPERPIFCSTLYCRLSFLSTLPGCVFSEHFKSCTAVFGQTNPQLRSQATLLWASPRPRPPQTHKGTTSALRGLPARPARELPHTSGDPLHFRPCGFSANMDGDLRRWGELFRSATFVGLGCRG